MKSQPASKVKLHTLSPGNEFTYNEKPYRLITPCKRIVPASTSTCQVMDLKTMKAAAMNCNNLVAVKN